MIFEDRLYTCSKDGSVVVVLWAGWTVEMAGDAEFGSTLGVAGEVHSIERKVKQCGEIFAYPRRYNQSVSGES